MKKYILALALLAAGCKKDDPADKEFTVETQGRNRDCGLPQVAVLDNQEVFAKIVGRTLGDFYIAHNLDTTLWLRKNQMLLVRIRPTNADEATICTAMGPGYPHLTVVTARVKP